jgi:hypothetical protein
MSNPTAVLMVHIISDKQRKRCVPKTPLSVPASIMGAMARLPQVGSAVPRNDDSQFR